jgi:hypothetical protein
MHAAAEASACVRHRAALVAVCDDRWQSVFKETPERRSESVTEPTIDRDAMGRLARALAFICGAEHPTTVALRTASETGTEKDIKAARALFLRLKPNERRSALAMLQDD